MDTSLNLLARLRQKERDPAAWDRFVQLYSPMLYCWAQRMGLQEQESLDVVQEVLTLMLCKLVDFQHDGRSFRGWLRTVVRNRCRDHLRRLGRAPQGLASGSEVPAPAANPGEDLEEAEFQGMLIQQAIRLMHSEFREATWKSCWLTVAEGMSSREAAQVLGLTVNAVLVARSRVLRRLRAEFGEMLN